MELIEREWLGVRFSLGACWTVFLAETGSFAFGSGGESFVVSRRAEPLDVVAETWRRRLDAMGARRLSETSASGPVPGVLRVMALGPPDPRIVTQLMVGGPATVTASYAARADHSYDRDQADAVIRSIRVDVAGTA